jgi:hypothetical protein
LPRLAPLVASGTESLPPSRITFKTTTSRQVSWDNPGLRGRYLIREVVREGLPPLKEQDEIRLRWREVMLALEDAFDLLRRGRALATRVRISQVAS